MSIPYHIYSMIAPRPSPVPAYQFTASTLKVYSDTYARIKTRLGPRPTIPELDQITADKSPSTRLTYYRSVIFNLERDPLIDPEFVDELRSRYKVLNVEYQRAKEWRNPTPEEIEAIFNYEILEEKIDEYRRLWIADGKTYRVAYLLCALYALLPPLRCSEYCTAVVKKDDTPIASEETANVFDITTNKFIVRDHKTKSKYGTKYIDIPHELADIVREVHTGHFSGMWLLFSRTNKNTVNAKLSQVTGHKTGSSHLRSIYVSQVVNKLPNDEKKRIAAIMGHSMQAQQGIYGRLSSENLPQTEAHVELSS